MQPAALPINKHDSRNMFAGEMSPQIDVAEFGRFLDDPDKFIDAGQPLNNDGISRTVRARIGDVDLVIKRFHWPPVRQPQCRLRIWLRAMRHTLQQKNSAKSSWQTSFLLQSLGVKTPPPLAWVQQKRGKLKGTNWFLYAFVEGYTAREILTNPNVSRAHKEKIIAAYEILLRDLLEQKIYLREATDTNFLLTSIQSTQPVLIDFHKPRRRMNVYRNHKRKYRKSLNRKIKNMRRDYLADE